MAESSQHPPPPGGPGGGARPGDAPGQLRALSAALAIAAGSALLGIAGGLIWAAIAPQAQFVVASRGAAYVVNPETSAFIAADGWYSAIAVAGGAIIGLAAYLLGVRRFGPLPAAGALVGATAAAFLAWWAGRNVGLAAFRHRLEISKPGALIRQPADLGAHGALAFWPLAAGVVIGGIELVLALREQTVVPSAVWEMLFAMSLSRRAWIVSSASSGLSSMSRTSAAVMALLPSPWRPPARWLPGG